MNETIHKNGVIIVLIVVLITLILTFYGFRGEESIAPISEENTEETADEEETSSSPTETTGGTSHAPSEQEIPQLNDVSEAPPIPTPSIPESTMVVVTYTDSGFIPPVVEVVHGKSVTFVNSSSRPMRVTSAYHPTATEQLYPEFEQPRSVPSGGTYTFPFTRVGVWGYKNLNFDSHLGAISVIAQ